MEDVMKDRLGQLLDYIMKKCLWQFHSRSWDRERQNEGILTKTMQLLCEEPVEKDTPFDKCLWVDAVILAEAFKSKYQWLSEMNKEEIKTIMQELKEKMDYLTIHGSLNEELKDPLY